MKNPFDKVKIPKAEIEEEREPIPFELLYELLKKLQEVDLFLFNYCVLIYLTGLRPGDIIRLRYEKHIKYLKGIKCIEIKESKNKKRNRGKTIIPVHPDLEELILKGRDNKDTGYIFEYNYKRSNAVLRLGKVFKKKVTSDFTPYQFRHTFASELVSRVTNETYINFLMGKLPEGTLKNYLKSKIKTLHEIICKLPGIVTLLSHSPKLPVKAVV